MTDCSHPLRLFFTILIYLVWQVSTFPQKSLSCNYLPFLFCKKTSGAPDGFTDTLLNIGDARSLWFTRSFGGLFLIFKRGIYKKSKLDGSQNPMYIKRSLSDFERHVTFLCFKLKTWIYSFASAGMVKQISEVPGIFVLSKNIIIVLTSLDYVSQTLLLLF